MTTDGNGIVDAPLTKFVSEMECITCQTPPNNKDATVSETSEPFKTESVLKKLRIFAQILSENVTFRMLVTQPSRPVVLNAKH